MQSGSPPELAGPDAQQLLHPFDTNDSMQQGDSEAEPAKLAEPAEPAELAKSSDGADQKRKRFTAQEKIKLLELTFSSTMLDRYKRFRARLQIGRAHA
eukprot:SAG22_NODE_10884_length_512_cov_0.692494_1_plen_98_part_00